MHNEEDRELARVKGVFGGVLSEIELSLLRRIERTFQDVVDTQGGFMRAVGSVAQELVRVVDSESDLNLQSNIDMLLFQGAIARNPSLLISCEEDKELTAKEKEFSLDVVAAIDFVIRNGIGFGLMGNVLSHDIAEILIHGGIENNAGFSPKVSGWAHYDESSIGDPDEPEA